MTESKNKKKYQENQDSQPSDETQTEYSEISKEEKNGLKRVYKESRSKTQAEYSEIKGANLRWANLTGCEGLTQEQLDSACGNEKTKLPQGLTIKKCK
jgi:hypothetical protein